MDEIDELCSAIQEEMNWQLEEWINERKDEMWEEQRWESNRSLKM